MKKLGFLVFLVAATQGLAAETTYDFEYDVVWTAAQATLDKYQFEQLDKDSGLISTKWLDTSLNGTSFPRKVKVSISKSRPYLFKVEVIAKSGMGRRVIASFCKKEESRIIHTMDDSLI